MTRTIGIPPPRFLHNNVSTEQRPTRTRLNSDERYLKNKRPAAYKKTNYRCLCRSSWRKHGRISTPTNDAALLCGWRISTEYCVLSHAFETTTNQQVLCLFLLRGFSIYLDIFAHHFPPSFRSTYVLFVVNSDPGSRNYIFLLHPRTVRASQYFRENTLILFFLRQLASNCSTKSFVHDQSSAFTLYLTLTCGRPSSPC